MEALSIIFSTLVEIGVNFLKHLPMIVTGILVILAFNWLARVLQNTVRSVSQKSNLDMALASIFSGLTGIVVRIFGVLLSCVIVIPSFNPGSLIAGLGLSSVAIGFAFKDILQNFVAGILILWNKPFSVGDVIETGGHTGTVANINVRSTHIDSFDGKRIIIPNGTVFGNDVKVYSANPNRRISIPVGIGYGDDIDKAGEAMLEAVKSVDGVLETPEPQVFLTGLGGSSVDFEVQVWLNQSESSYIKVRHESIKAVKQALDKHEIDIPYNYTVLQFDSDLAVTASERSKNGENGKNKPSHDIQSVSANN